MHHISSGKDDMNRQILSATETLIAEIGIQNLSMRKIATQAGIALGTLYLYFKTKDDLLRVLAHDLFERFHLFIAKDYDESAPLFDRYRKLFENKLAFLREFPTVAANLSQYQAMLGFNELVERIVYDENFVWNKFVYDGQQAGVIVNLPAELLHILGIGVAIDVVDLQQILKKEYSEAIIEEMLLRSWKAISLN